jgi:AmmeMemoRadiSam system protein A
MNLTVTRKEQQVLLTVARSAISDAMDGADTPETDEPQGILAERHGAFVTLKLDGELRGCIGSMTGHDRLINTVRDMARSAAFHDPRFAPLRPEELEKVRIEISILSPMERLERIEDLVVGRHGLYIAMGSRSGVLLPQVAVEQGWGRETFLSHCCRKAGLSANAWRTETVQISVFEAAVFGEDD